MFCGAGSFPRVDEDPWSLPSPPRVSSRRQGRSSNPYSTRGLDKFSTVLVDLESRREKIMARAGAEGVSVVRFMYSSSHDWVPIVVRPREQRPEPEKPKKGAAAAESGKKPDAVPKEHQAPPRMDAKGAAPAEPAPNRVLKKSFSRKVGGRSELGGFFRWDPSYYWPVVVVLILICLAFGRAFAICCTSMCWYSLPRAMVDEGRNVKKAVKEYRRRASEKQLGAGGGDVAKKDGDLLGFASHGHHRSSTTTRRGL